MRLRLNMREQMLRIQTRAFDLPLFEIRSRRLQDFEERHHALKLVPWPLALGRGLFCKEPTIPRMELLALVAISLMSLIGWVVATECLGKWIDHDSRFYFAPALGMASCAIIAYVASGTRQTWLIHVFLLYCPGRFP